MTVILFLIILGALVFVHELGHFIAAKKAGIRVDEFALGFPPKIVAKKVGETTYSLNLVPFGGYVKIFGEDGEVAADSPADEKRSFGRKSKWIQAAVLASGVFGNIIFAWLLISASFAIGIPSSAEGRYADSVRDPVVTVTSVIADSPADRAGLRQGDEIISLADGTKTYEGTDAEDARAFIADSAGPISVHYRRGDSVQVLDVEPAEGIVEGKIAIGVRLDAVGVVQLSVFRSLYEGVLTAVDLLREVTLGLFGFIREAVMGKADLESIAGPVGIAGLVGEARHLGLVYILSFTAFISINLAVINLLPIPALDGGRLLFLAIEGATRRTIPAKVSRTVNTVGFVLLILFMLFITYRDILKLL